MNVYELNLDGLVGPTHNYAGLSPGNIAAMNNALTQSNPRDAALQGLAKMKLLHSMGLKQGLLPPHQRPNLKLLHELGFSGSPKQQISKAYKTAPELLNTCYSASSMWAANAATVSASADTEDRKLHFTTANLISNLHRQQESEFTTQLLRFIFSDKRYFTHHPVLPKSCVTSDEGAANHNRLCEQHDKSGINVFVYGKKALQFKENYLSPQKFPARQTLEASQIVARAHLLNPKHVVFAQQNPLAIDLGVFHNDVICVANESVLFLHEEAWQDQALILNEIKKKAAFALTIIEVPKTQISIDDAVASYLFNSQLISLPKQNKMVLIAPLECHDHPAVKRYLDELILDSNNPIHAVHYLDLRQSMRNGGGPACLRIRIPINEQELSAMHQGVLITNHLLEQLESWIVRHYRSHLEPQDLSDPQLIEENFQALDELTQILHLGSIYPFQTEGTV